MFYQWIVVALVVSTSSGSIKASLSEYDVKSYLEFSDQLMQMTPNFTLGYYCWHGPEHKFQYNLQRYTQDEYRHLKPVILPMKNDWKMQWYRLFLKYSKMIDHMMKSAYENWNDEEGCPDEDNDVEKTQSEETYEEEWTRLVLMERYFNLTLKFVRPVLNFVYAEILYRSRLNFRGPYTSKCLTESDRWLEEKIRKGEEALNVFLRQVEEGKRLRRNEATISKPEEIHHNLRYLWRTMKNAIMWNCAYISRFGTIHDFENRFSTCVKGSGQFYERNN